MVGKVSERVLLREGLERTDNGMRQSTWPDVTPINQKNYYTEYMKRDDQVLALRTQNDANRDRLVQSAKDRDRALNQNGELPLPLPEPQVEESVDAADPSKIIVIHPGSQNLRIGLASDALPKTIPMCLATRFTRTESEEHEALPRRQFEAQKLEQRYGEEWSKKFKKMSDDLKIDMRQNKRKVLPNSKELVANFNRRTEPEMITQHNDRVQIDWTEVEAVKNSDASDAIFYGQPAQRIPDDSDPKYRLWWPMQQGWLNEDDYTHFQHLYDDFEDIFTQTFKHELGLKGVTSCQGYSCVFVIPDLYDKRYVEMILKMMMEWFEFSKVCFIQESVAATCGAGYSQACVVDVGAQKTSIACVEDGLILEDSRVNLKYGGYDVTETFIKMMLHDHFPYQDMNLRRRYDFLLAEELKQKHCTMSQADISVQLYQFHLRVPNKDTEKYQFKTYDEVILAPMGFYEPAIFDNSAKLRGRRKLVDRSYNAYDLDYPDDPISGAQIHILALERPSVVTNGNGVASGPQNDVATPSKERTRPFEFLTRGELNGTPATSNAPSPAPEGASTPVPAPFIFGAGKDSIKDSGSPAPSGRNGGTPAPAGQPAATLGTAADAPPVNSAKELAIERDSVLPTAPLDMAIMTAIHNAAKGDERKLKEFLGSIMVIGGGAKIPHFTTHLEERIRARQRHDWVDRVLVSRSARDMDEQVVVWKGASVFAKLPTNDSWIAPFEYRFHGARVLHHKVLWAW